MQDRRSATKVGRGGMCTHTHITRSDYLEKLVDRQKLGGGSITACFAETKRQRSGSGLESLRTDPHPMRRRDTST